MIHLFKSAGTRIALDVNSGAIHVLDGLAYELLDRFGEPPEPVLGLVDIALVRAAAVRCGIYEIGLGGERVSLFIEELNMPMIRAMGEALPGRVKVSAGSGKPFIAVKLEPKRESLLHTLRKVLGAAERAAAQNPAEMAGV